MASEPWGSGGLFPAGDTPRDSSVSLASSAPGGFGDAKGTDTADSSAREAAEAATPAPGPGPGLTRIGPELAALPAGCGAGYTAAAGIMVTCRAQLRV